ncbi:hypothetical protein B0H14DRAFT_2585105 [Mycena olivaceomarginata]|nr:hypothetical protein B0H14DRAFT_2585105 [Mycena olivaceomarginata]
MGSDGNEQGVTGENEPPKKRRRRQALSCTECKRRKIRCDRAPCVGRGDQAKRQWHVVEPAFVVELLPSAVTTLAVSGVATGKRIAPRRRDVSLKSCNCSLTSSRVVSLSSPKVVILSK